MTKLRTQPNITDVDGLYQRLIDEGADRDDAESLRFMARLVLILLNHIGDEAVALEAIALAQRTNRQP